MNEMQKTRFEQGRAALNEVKALRESGMDIQFVLSQLYQAYYYPVIALVYDGKVPETMQSVTIGLFQQRFVDSGIIGKEHGDAVRRIFELKPKCSGGCLLVTPDEIDSLVEKAGAFLAAVETFLSR